MASFISGHVFTQVSTPPSSPSLALALGFCELQPMRINRRHAVATLTDFFNKIATTFATKGQVDKSTSDPAALGSLSNIAASRFRP